MIPPKLCKEIMRLLHTGHQGIEKTRSYAREAVYWPNMNKDIERVCKECITCQEYMERSANANQSYLTNYEENPGNTSHQICLTWETRNSYSQWTSTATSH